MVCWVIVATAASNAQESAGSDQGYSWVEATHPISGERTLVFLPPAAERTRPGQLAVARRLTGPLRAMAAKGESVTIVQDNRVFRLTAGTGGPPGAWAFRPLKGFSPLPSLPELSSVDGIGVFDTGTIVLAESGESLLRLAAGRWETFPVPEGGFGADASVVAGHHRGAAVLATGPTGLRLWLLDEDGWRVESFFVEGVRPSDVVAWKDGLFAVRASRGDNEGEPRWSVDAVTLDGLAPVVSGIEAPADAVPVVRAESGRLAFVWSVPVDPSVGSALAQSSGPTGWRIVEVSLLTGEELYRGDGGPAVPVSTEDFRRLALLLFVFTVLVLLGALGPRAADQVVVLPHGVALASPGARAAAWLVDAAPAVALASLVGGGSVLTAAVFLAILHSSIGEALFGRSLGKALLGLRVVSVATVRTDGGRVDASAADAEHRAVRRPTLWAALARNGVRFLLPPVAAFGAASRERRHMGDVSTRTAVVVSPRRPPSEGNTDDSAPEV